MHQGFFTRFTRKNKHLSVITLMQEFLNAIFETMRINRHLTNYNVNYYSPEIKLRPPALTNICVITNCNATRKFSELFCFIF